MAGTGMVAVGVLLAVLFGNSSHEPGMLTATSQAADTSNDAEVKAKKSDVDYEEQVLPYFKKYCYDCHGEMFQRAGVELHIFAKEEDALKNREVWEKVYGMLEVSAMPPEEHDAQPTPDENALVLQWIHDLIFDIDCTEVRDPGRVTIRRLNRAEYNNTIRDLVGVEFRPADDFPSDDVGYGFDNIGDVLSLPPLLMEKYLDAAEQIAGAAIVTEDVTETVVRKKDASELRHSGNHDGYRDGFRALPSNAHVNAEFRFPVEGEYILRAEAQADQAGPDPARMEFRLGSEKLKVFDIEGQRKPGVYEHRLRIKPGNQQFAAAFINDYYKPDAPDPKDRGDRNLYVKWLEVEGPFDAVPPEFPETHRRIMIAEPGPDKTVREAAEEILRPFATRAFRRPVQQGELERLVRLVEFAQEEGENFARSIQLAVQAVLVSPHFLFRVEQHPDPDNPQHLHQIRDYELATRLSYFLWSSMPDEELLLLAENGQLHRPEILESQVKRMMQDPRADALVENFASQWLNLRNLSEFTPDPEKFSTFDDHMRADMLRETELFFQAMLKEDRSLPEFLTADFTFVNGRLAQHYGFEGVQGDEFQRVSLEGTSRAGVLTHASILSLTSNPTRTSPVKRGKWIMENIFGSPPPPPPPNVPELEETAKASPDASLREQLALHREHPGCASCHKEMDPLGLGFENFDVLGRWRDKDGDLPVDASGSLPSGDTFKGPLELVDILSKRDEDFARCLSEKMLTYALGRGLEYYDKCAIDKITEALKQNDYRFSTLVTEIVKSEPFLTRRGDGGE